MNKTELVNFIAEETNVSKSDINRVYDAMVKGIEKGLNDSKKVTLPGFVTFTAKDKEASTARNPRTGESIPVPARTVVTIKAGSKLKESVN